MVEMTDPLAVTVDAQGRRWIRCASCAGSGRLRQIDWAHNKPKEWIFKGPTCPDCNGAGQVEVP